MKLKKIASLMLAGIMAVSMLAGCNGTADVNENDKPNDVTGGSNIVSIVNAAVKGNKAGITFAADADLTKALEIVVRENGVKETTANLTADLVKELDVNNAGFNAAGLNSWAQDVEKESVNVYMVSGKNETSLSAAYQIAADIAGVVNSLTNSTANTASEILDYTYSDAFVSMMEVTVDDTNYYFVAVTLNSLCESR